MDIPKRLDENGNVTNEFYQWALDCCNKGIEVFVPIDGWEDLYEISNMGNVRSLERKSWNGSVWFTKEERILSPNRGTNGYLSVQLCKNGTTRRREIHRLMGLCMIPNPENKATINHDDGVKHNLLLSNLFWNTYSENNKHAIRTGLNKPPVLPLRYGKDNPTSKPIIQFSISGDKMKRFDSISIASKDTGIKMTTLSMCLNKRNHTAGGFKWAYESMN